MEDITYRMRFNAINKIRITVLISFLLISTNIYVADINSNQKTIIYVDINGGADFTSIQSAINASSNGDEIFVYSGLYNENLLIDKEINLIGENRESTVIEGLNNFDVIKIISNNVQIFGFTIKNSGYSGRDAGIEINANYANITDNIILDNNIGIFLFNSNNHFIANNEILNNNDYGIHLYDSYENNILNNNVESNRWGILLISAFANQIEENNILNNEVHGLWLNRGCWYNTINENIISNNNGHGILIQLYSQNNTISRNHIKENQRSGIYIGFYWQCSDNIVSENTIELNHEYGISLYDSQNIQITSNDFIGTQTNAYFNDCNYNTWNDNYWNEPRDRPYLIIGKNGIIPWINFDLNPASQPHKYHYLNKAYAKDLTYKPRYVNNILTDLPSSFDWRNINGTNYVPEAKNQIPAPLCETYALCAALETIVNFKLGSPYDCDLSEAHLFFYTGGTCDWGVEVSMPAEYLIYDGVPDEGCFPDPHRPFDSPYESLEGWEERTVKITESGWISNDINEIKQSLIQYGPIIICQMTKKDLDSYESGVYMPSINSPIQRGHVVAIVGYDDDNQCFILRNSAGENWGENGYFRASYDGFNPEYDFVFPFYGGSGLLYVDGVYGNMRPDVPKIRFNKPRLYYSYFNGFEFPMIFKYIDSYQISAPRIYGDLTVQVDTDNTDYVEFYINGELAHTDNESPYEWDLEASTGLHTLEVFAYNQNYASTAIVDAHII
jgi:parallel beta-helix repeat protein